MIIRTKKHRTALPWLLALLCVLLIVLFGITIDTVARVEVPAIMKITLRT